MKNQTIRCQIESCQHNAPDHYCQLNAIKVAPCSPNRCDNVTNRSDSMCENFEKKDRSFF